MLLYIIHLSTILLLLSLGDNKVSYHKDNIYTPQSFPTPFQHPVQLFPFLYLEHASRNLVSCGNGILLPYCPSKVTVWMESQNQLMCSIANVTSGLSGSGRVPFRPKER